MTVQEAFTNFQMIIDRNNFFLILNLIFGAIALFGLAMMILVNTDARRWLAHRITLLALLCQVITLLFFIFS